MGRKLLFRTKELDQRAYDLAALGYSDRKIARELGIHYNTILNYKKRPEYASFVKMLEYGRECFKQLRIIEALWRVYKVGRQHNSFKNGEKKTRSMGRNHRIFMIQDMAKAGVLPEMKKIIAETPDIDLRALKTYNKLMEIV